MQRVAPAAAVLLVTLIAAGIAGTIVHLNGVRTIAIGDVEITLSNGWRPLAGAAALSVIALFTYWRLPRVRTMVFAVILGLMYLAIFLTLQSSPQQWVAGDLALFEIYTRNAASGQQMLGAYSQFGWNHPGPLPFYTFLPFYLLGGHGQHALNGGALAINLLALFVIAWVTLRHGGGSLAVIVGAALLIYLVRIPELASSFWNPHILVLPLAAWLVVCAAIAIGETALLPLAVLIGSWMIHAHVGLAIAVVTSAIVTAGLALRSRRPIARSTMWLTAAAATIVWALPVAQQLAHTPGNMRRIIDFFLLSDGAGPSIGASVRAAGAMVAGVFRSAFRLAPGLSFEPMEWRWVIVTVVLTALVALIARAEWRRGARYNAALGIGCLALVAAGHLSAANIRGTIGDYQLFWLSIVGVVAAAVIVNAAVQPLVRIAGTAPLTTITLLLYAASCAVTFLAFAERATPPRPPESHTVETLTDAVTLAINNGLMDRILLEVDSLAWDTAAGMVLHLSKGGIEVNVDPRLVWLYGNAYGWDGRENAVVTVAKAANHEKVMQQPGRVLLAERNGVFISMRRIEPVDANLTVR